MSEYNNFQIKRRLLLSGVLIISTFLIGVMGYWLLGRGRWSLTDCAYMTVISLTTVGYSEVIDVSNQVGGRWFTMFLIVFGIGVFIYFVTNLTAFVVEGELRHIIWRRRMQKTVKKLKNHIIVCGVGETGMQIVKELISCRWDFVMIDIRAERLSKIQTMFPGVSLPSVIGDASEDDVLIEAGIKNAYGLIAALSNDKDNLFVTVSARQLNRNIKIVARCSDPSSLEKLKRAGADSVVSIKYIGGMRMVSEMIRPHVTSFLDLMLRDKDRNLRIEEVSIHEGSNLVGKSIRDTEIRKQTDLLIIAIQEPMDGRFIYNPSADFTLQKDMKLIVLGDIDSVQKLRSSV